MTSAAPRADRNPWAWIPSLYLAQGLPFAVVNFISVILYKSLGISNADIAFYTAWLYLPWVIKPLWSPVVDILRTRRWWIWICQLVMGAAFAAVGLTLPLPAFFQASLVVFYLIAFASATHDIAADGFYLLALNEKQQAFFVGVRSTFFRVSLITGQGLLVMLAGFIQTQTSLSKIEIAVTTQPEAVVLSALPTTPLIADHTNSLHLLAQTTAVAINSQSQSRAEITPLLAEAREWNATNLFTRTRQQMAKATAQSDETSWWTTQVSQPLAGWLRKNFGPEDESKSDRAGNLGIVALQLSQPPGREIVVTPVFKSGDKSLSLVEGARLVFDDQNWNRPALVVFQADAKLVAAATAQFEIRSGNIVLSWTMTFAVLVGLFLVFGLYHKFILPQPEKDRPGDVASIPVFLKEFFLTFGSYFRKDHIGVFLLFLLFYRFAEAQLVKLAAPFLLDAREAGGLALTTGQVGFVYGTVGTLAFTVGGILGGIAASRHGLRAWLWPMVLAIQVPNTVYVYLAAVRPDSFWIINACVAIEQFGYGFGFAAYLLVMIYVARGAHQTAHYAICTGFMALGMMLPGMWSGWLQEAIGYQNFFIWVLLATIPGFLVVKLIPVDREFGKKA
jgi:PAT family beta-lactamase induction signal transducer AmpG